VKSPLVFAEAWLFNPHTSAEKAVREEGARIDFCQSAGDPSGSIGWQAGCKEMETYSLFISLDLTDPSVWASLLTLTAMEIVLGIDNVVFVSLVVSRLKKGMQKGARQFGLILAFVFRIIMLSGITWMMGLKESVFSVLGHDISWKDIILIAGGLFLIVKATQEIHTDIEGTAVEQSGPKASDVFILVIAQIAVIDLVFSIDSIVTAVGMAEHLEVMIVAVLIAMIVMYIASGTIAAFIQEHPTTKMLALSFLFMIGTALIADGLGFHIPRGYIYFAMAFSGIVEMFNVFAKKKRKKNSQATR
jgi:predicted tellurium resistance membrane protein TerC